MYWSCIIYDLFFHFINIILFQSILENHFFQENVMKDKRIDCNDSILDSSRYQSKESHQFRLERFIYIRVKGYWNSHFYRFYLHIVNIYLLGFLFIFDINRRKLIELLISLSSLWSFNRILTTYLVNNLFKRQQFRYKSSFDHELCLV